MEQYLADSYESKLNSLFKPISISKNLSFNSNQNIKSVFEPLNNNKYPIYIPTDNNNLFTPNSPNNFYNSTSTISTVENGIEFEIPSVTLVSINQSVSPTLFPIHLIPLNPNEDDLFNKSSSLVSTASSEYEGGNNRNETLIPIFPPIEEVNPIYNNETSTELVNRSEYYPSTQTPIIETIEITKGVASSELLMAYGIFVIVLSIGGIISNSATIQVLFSKENLNLHIRKHYTNMTILSLAIANLLTSIFVGILSSVKLFLNLNARDGENEGNSTSNNYPDPLLSKIQCFFNNLASFVCVWTLALITVDRFFAHNWPVKYNQLINRKRFALFMIYIWVQGILFSSLNTFLWDKPYLQSSRGSVGGLCRCLMDGLVTNSNSFSAPLTITTLSKSASILKIISFLWMQLLPISLILTLNLVVVHNMVKQRAQIDTIQVPYNTSADEIHRNLAEFHMGVGGSNRVFRTSGDRPFVWQVMPPPPLTLPHPPEMDINRPIQQLFSSTVLRRNPLIQQLRQQQQEQIFNAQNATLSVSRESSTQSVLNCYLAVIFSYLWLHTIPGSITFLLLTSKTNGFAPILSEMMTFLFNLIGLSVNAMIYYWFRKDFHYAFKGLIHQLCLNPLGRVSKSQRASNIDQWW